MNLGAGSADIDGVRILHPTVVSGFEGEGVRHVGCPHIGSQTVFAFTGSPTVQEAGSLELNCLFS